MVHPVLVPYEITWEQLLLEGIHAQFHDPDLPLEVEIGPGDDDFFVRRARQRPDVNWLAIEYSHKRVRRAIRRLERYETEHEGATHEPAWKNVRLLWRPALDVLGPFLSPEQVHAYHIYFPDPWPKAHHARFRLLQRPFLEELSESLVAGGKLLIATDSRDYAEQVLEESADIASLENLIGPPGFAHRPRGEDMTPFEEQWRQMGRTIHALEFERRAAD